MRTSKFCFYRCVKNSVALARSILPNRNSNFIHKESYPGKDTSPEWLSSAIHMEPRLISDFDALKPIFDEVLTVLLQEVSVPPGKSMSRFKYTNKVILINLFVAYKSGVPVYYSRDNNDYSPGKRYRQVYFSKTRVFTIIDTLTKLGLVHHVKGFNDEYKGFRSRMWASKELVELFEKIQVGNRSVYAKKSLSLNWCN